MQRYTRHIDLFVFGVFLTLYWLTLSPGLLPADAGEFQYVAKELGVAHPPGYALYTMLAHLFTYLMPQNPARAVNLFSAVTAALTVMLAGRAARLFSESVLAGIVTSVTLGLVPSVWVTATQASIRPLTGFFTVLCVERLAALRTLTPQIPLPQFASRTRRGGSIGGRTKYISSLQENDGALVGFTLVFGLGVVHHPSLVFPGVFFVVYLLLLDPMLLRQPRHWLLPAGAFLIGFVPWLYLIVRGAQGAALAPADLATWRGFWRHVLARGFSGDLFVFSTATELLDRFVVWINIMVLEWGEMLLILTVVALVVLAVRRWKVLVLLVGGFGLHSFVTMTYRAPQTVEYLIPAYVLIAIALGTGLGEVRHFVKRTPAEPRFARAMPAALSFLAVGASLVGGLRTWPSIKALAEDNATQQMAESMLEQAPPNAVILSSWHWATPMWALQASEGMRPDVEVVYVFPDGAEPLADTWVRRIDQYINNRPVMVTSYYPTAFEAVDYIYEPLDTDMLPGSAWLVRGAHQNEIPADMRPLDIAFDNGVVLVGVDTPQILEAGQTFEVRLAWRVDTAQAQDLFGYAHFSYPDGRVISPDDRLLPTSRVEIGDVLVEKYTLGVPPGLEQGQYNLLVGLRDAEGLIFSEGVQRVQAAVMAVEGAQYVVTGNPAPVVIGGEMYLSDVRVTPADVLHPGGDVVVDLTFFSTQANTHDRVVKVDIIGPEFAWRVQSDHIPATGAIPTLKWLTGWEVKDRHRFEIPVDAAPGPVRAELVVYDHFTNEVLPLLDPAVAEQGEALVIQQWTLEP